MLPAEQVLALPASLWEGVPRSLKEDSTKMLRVQVSRPHGPLEIVEHDIPAPGPGSVRIKVLACGICHSDVVTREGVLPGIQYPRVPGHEVVGVIDALGSGVAGWRTGQRVGVGWHGGNCGYCDACRRGNFFACQTETRTTGVTYDGGYAEFRSEERRVGKGGRRRRARARELG